MYTRITDATELRSPTMKNFSLVALLTGLLTSHFAAAHHGPPTDSSLFYTDRIVEMDAEIITIFWRNPHVRFKVKIVNDYGEEEEWQIELRRGPTSFRNIGINKDFLSPGDKVKIAGYPSRRKTNLLGLMNMLLPDGRELVEPNVEARFSDRRLFSGTAGASVPAAIPGRGAPEVAVRSDDGIFRVWGMVGSQIPEVPVSEYIDYLTNTAHALRARFIPSRDDPELKCQSGMPSTMFDPPPMQIRRYGQDIVIHLQEYDIVRTIHMDGGNHSPEPSRLGHSTGRWEDDTTLVIRTTHVNWPFFDPWGTPQSDRVSYVERFTLDEKANRLNYSLVADDPVMFVEPVVLERSWRWLPSAKLGKFDCTLWDGDTEYDPETSNPFARD